MSWYEVLKAAHVLAAVVWVGGALAVQWYDRRLRRRCPDDVVQQLADAEFFGAWVFIPASLASLLSGLALTAERDWDFEPFITVGIGAWLVAFITGAAYHRPKSRGDGHSPVDLELPGVTAHLPKSGMVQLPVEFLDWLDREGDRRRVRRSLVPVHHRQRAWRRADSVFRVGKHCPSHLPTCPLWDAAVG